MKNLKNIDFSQYYDELKFAGLAAVVLIALIYLVRYLKRVEGPQRTIEIDENNLTLTETKAQLIADNLMAAMDRIGTDEDLIYNEFDKIKTAEDMILVSEKFGVHKYGQGGRVQWLGYDKNLKGWINAELTDKEKKPIQNKLSWM